MSYNVHIATVNYTGNLTTWYITKILPLFEILFIWMNNCSKTTLVALYVYDSLKITGSKTRRIKEHWLCYTLLRSACEDNYIDEFSNINY